MPCAVHSMNPTWTTISGRTQCARKRGRPRARVNGVFGISSASPGTYEGTVRVILGEHEFDKLEDGDVLVCPITSPIWSMLFPQVGALVCDAGGPMSHPAIIAREFGIPAVVGTERATTTFRDGERVLVDGDNGVVTRVGG